MRRNGLVVGGAVVNYPVFVTISNPESNIKPGMTENLAVQVDHRVDVLLVPTRAVRTQGNQKIVTVEQNGHSVPVPVGTGLSNYTQVEITDGLREGDVIVRNQTQTRQPNVQMLGVEANVSRGSRISAGIAMVLGTLFIALIGGITLGPSLVSVSGYGSETSQATATATLTPTASTAIDKARALVARVRDEVIPREGLATDYGVSFSQEGYQTLIRWNADYKVEPGYADTFESLNLGLPCCGWSKPNRDEKANCACGHHQALEGLAKKLLADGQSGAMVQGEVSRWARYMFPKEALAAELERRAVLDPETKDALEELKARGEC